MDRAAFRQRVFRKAMATPWTLVPAALGAASMLLALAIGEPGGFFGFLGISGVLLGAGVAAPRLVLFPEQLAREVHTEAQGAAQQDEVARLTTLERQFAASRDSEGQQLVERLRQAWQRAQAAGELHGAARPEMLPEITSNLRRLYE